MVPINPITGSANSTDCETTSHMLKAVNKNLQISNFLISLAGVFLNSLAILVLSYVPNRSQKFIQYLQIYSLSCLVINLNLAVVTYFKVFFSDAANSFSNFYIASVIVYALLPLYSFCHTFVMLLDILIAYERIQMFNLDLTFLRKTPAWTLFLLAALFTLILSIPLGLSLAVEPLYSSRTYSLVLNDLYRHRLYKIVVMLIVFVKHVLVFAVELLVNAYLVVCMRKFYRNRPQGQARGLSSAEWKNDAIILVMCFLSIVQQVFTLLRIYFIFDEHICSETLTFLTVFGFFNFNFKHALNFFILAALNSHFRKSFQSLLPRRPFGISCFAKKPSIPVEHVHLETVVTRM